MLPLWVLLMSRWTLQEMPKQKMIPAVTTHLASDQHPTADPVQRQGGVAPAGTSTRPTAQPGAHLAHWLCCRSRAKSAERDRSLSVVSDVEKEAGALTEEEARALGKVSRSTYVAYIKELGGMCFFVAVCMLFLLSLVRVLCWRRAVAGLYVTPMHVQATMIGSDVWLGIWTNASDTGDLTFYLTMYVAVGCTQALPNLHTLTATAPDIGVPRCVQLLLLGGRTLHHHRRQGLGVCPRRREGGTGVPQQLAGQRAACAAEVLPHHHVWTVGASAWLPCVCGCVRAGDGGIVNGSCDVQDLEPVRQGSGKH